MLCVELIGAQHLNVGRLTQAEVRRDYHRYLLEDMSVLFAEYKSRPVYKDDSDEIGRRIAYLEQTYHSIVGRTFGIMFNTHSGFLDMLLYPI